MPEKDMMNMKSHHYRVRYVSGQEIKRNVYLLVDKERYLPPLVEELVGEIVEYFGVG